MSNSETFIRLKKDKRLRQESNAKLIAYGWGIVDKDGKAYMSEACVGHDAYDLEYEVEGLNEPFADTEDSAPFRVVQLFYKDEETKA